MGTRPTILAQDWLITTQHYLSAEAGAQVLRSGGNAVDAAVTAILCEGVLNPHMHTLGGEAPMLVYSARTGDVTAVNGNTCAPRAATIERFREAGLDGIPSDHPWVYGVPAAPNALLSALERWGTVSFSEAAAPAIRLASEGFPVHAGLRGPGENVSIARGEETFRKRWPASARIYLPGGRLPDVGERLWNPDLAGVLRAMTEAEGRAAAAGREAGLRAARDAFYAGDIAQAILRFSQRVGGLLTADDLTGFTTRFEAPIRFDYRGLTILKCGPWSQGGVLLQALGLLEGFDLRGMGHNSGPYLHHVVEALKLALADRERYYGDPAFARVPMDQLLSREYAAVRRPLIDPGRASNEIRPGDPWRGTALAGPAAEAAPWGPGTVHVNVVDRERNVVSATPSGAWITGSPVVEGLGFPLTVRPQFFTLEPGHPNALAPGKRPRTTLTPGIACANGRPRIAFGTMGGDHQDQWNLQVLLNVVTFGMEVQDAIEAPRLSTAHAPSSYYPHRASPGLVKIEARVPYGVRRELQALGHTLDLRPEWSEGYVLMIVIDEERSLLRGGADPRGEVATVIPGYAIGW